jgi:DNA-binding beta-propeller fold protein YncE
MTVLGDFPTGGALSPDGRFYWAVDSGHGQDDVQVVDVATGKVVQTLPLPGAYGGIAYGPDGRTVYVSGEPMGNSSPAGTTRANRGDAIHVFTVDPASGRATEAPPITLPPTQGGQAQKENGKRLSSNRQVRVHHPDWVGPWASPRRRTAACWWRR